MASALVTSEYVYQAWGLGSGGKKYLTRSEIEALGLSIMPGCLINYASNQLVSIDDIMYAGPQPTTKDYFLACSGEFTYSGTITIDFCKSTGEILTTATINGATEMKITTIGKLETISLVKIHTQTTEGSYQLAHLKCLLGNLTVLVDNQISMNLLGTNWEVNNIPSDTVVFFLTKNKTTPSY